MVSLYGDSGVNDKLWIENDWRQAERNNLRVFEVGVCCIFPHRTFSVAEAMADGLGAFVSVCNRSRKLMTTFDILEIVDAGVFASDGFFNASRRSAPAAANMTSPIVLINKPRTTPKSSVPLCPRIVAIVGWTLDFNCESSAARGSICCSTAWPKPTPYCEDIHCRARPDKGCCSGNRSLRRDSNRICNHAHCHRLLSFLGAFRSFVMPADSAACLCRC